MFEHWKLIKWKQLLRGINLIYRYWQQVRVIKDLLNYFVLKGYRTYFYALNPGCMRRCLEAQSCSSQCSIPLFLLYNCSRLLDHQDEGTPTHCCFIVLNWSLSIELYTIGYITSHCSRSFAFSNFLDWICI